MIQLLCVLFSNMHSFIKVVCLDVYCDFLQFCPYFMKHSLYIYIYTECYQCQYQVIRTFISDLCFSFKRE